MLLQAHSNQRIAFCHSDDMGQPERVAHEFQCSSSGAVALENAERVALSALAVSQIIPAGNRYLGRDGSTPRLAPY